MTAPDLATVTAVAVALNLSPETVRRRARALGIDRRYGKSWLFTPAEVERIRTCPDLRAGRTMPSRRHPAE